MFDPLSHEIKNSPDFYRQALLIETWYKLNKLDHNIFLHIGDNGITLSPVLEI